MHFLILVFDAILFGQAQLRELTLQEENAVYKNAISNCENKIQEKVLEADSLQKTLEERERERVRETGIETDGF